MADFTGPEDYLNQTISIPSSTTVDVGTGEVSMTTTSFSLREIICSLLAGNGINLPNLQLCLKINIGRLLGIPGIPAELYNALSDAEAALDEFIAHTNIDNVLARLNAAIAEFAAIANMINFCGTPVNPKPIPNVLKDIFGSYLGAGKSLLDKLGTMLDSDIGLCTSGGGFNSGIFQSGVLKNLGSIIDDFGSIANAPASTIASLTAELNAFSLDLNNLVKFENNFSGVNSNGGSTFGSTSAATTVHTGVGTAIDTSTLTLAHAQSIAGGLKSAYSSLSGYAVDEAGNSIFDYLLDPAMLAKLKANDLPTVATVDQQPTYDYCGRIIGYTAVSSVPTTISAGSPVTQSTAPGITGLAEAGTISNSPPISTTNLTNPNPMIKKSIPLSPKGKPGDKKGDIASDTSYIYIANADYNGITDIWVRSAVDTTWTTSTTLAPPP